MTNNLDKNGLEVEVLEGNVDRNTRIGEGISTTLAGITLTLDRSLSWDDKTSILLQLVALLLRLAGDDPGALVVETQRPFAFTGGLVFSGLANNTRSVFVAGPLLVPNKNSVQDVPTANLLRLLTGNKGIINPSNEGKNPDIFQVSIYDTNLCYNFMEAWLNDVSAYMQNIKIFIEDEKLHVNKVYFGLSVSSGLMDPAELASEFKAQAYTQNKHNVDLIPKELVFTRKRGMEQMHTVFKRGRKSSPHTLIVGSTSQTEMLYLVPSLISRSVAFVLNFTFVASKSKAWEIFQDLTREASIKQFKFILAGYFFEYMARLQKGNLFSKVYDTLDLLRIGNFSPRLRKPIVELGDPSLNWVKRSFTGILNTAEKNKGSLDYSLEIARFVREALKILPENLSFKTIESFASAEADKLGQKATEALQPLRDYTSNLGTLATVPVPNELFQSQTTEEIGAFLKTLTAPNLNSNAEKLIYNLNILVGFVEKPLVFLPSNVLKLAGTRFFRLMSRFFETRSNKEQKFSSKVNIAIQYLKDRTPGFNENFPSVVVGEIFKRPEFEELILPVADFVNNYIKNYGKKAEDAKAEDRPVRRGSKKDVDQFLMNLFRRVDPTFTDEKFAELVDNTYSLKIGSIERLVAQTPIEQDEIGKQIEALEAFVAKPLDSDLVFDSVKEFLRQPYEQLERSRKYRFTSFSNILAVLRLEAIESIEDLACAVADAAAGEEDPTKRDEMMDRSATYYEIAADLRDLLDGEGGKN